VHGPRFLADRDSPAATAGQQIVATATGSNGLALTISLIRASDGATVTGAYGSTSVTRLPSANSYTLPSGGTFLIEVSAAFANATGAYQVTLGSSTTPFPISGRVTVGRPGPGLANVTMTFTRLAGSGALPGPVTTDADGYWFQTGFEPGTSYRVTPSLATYDFHLPRQDFTQATTLDFTAAFIECSAFAVTPIAVGETKSGTLGAGDCR